MKKHALLVQAHHNIDYFIELAKGTPDVNIYVHLDKKSAYYPDAAMLAGVTNLHLLGDRVAVYWGGFSQVDATLKLFQAALGDADNAYFHLLSGEDVLLQDFEVIEKSWQRDFNFAMMMTCALASQYGYRFIMDSPHADTAWQRNIVGKVMTKVQQGFAKLIRYDEPIYFGSQWFSVTRDDWAKILPFTQPYREFFAKKLVPDEHFFQTIITKNLASQISPSHDNRRRIVFDKAVNNGNSPMYLDIAQLQQAKAQGFWFARKVTADTAKHWLIGETS